MVMLAILLRVLPGPAEIGLAAPQAAELRGDGSSFRATSFHALPLPDHEPALLKALKGDARRAWDLELAPLLEAHDLVLERTVWRDQRTVDGDQIDRITRIYGVRRRIHGQVFVDFGLGLTETTRSRFDVVEPLHDSLWSPAAQLGLHVALRETSHGAIDLGLDTLTLERGEVSNVLATLRWEFR
jgi:hypothetical protein